jgi:hypothetical protein
VSPLDEGADRPVAAFDSAGRPFVVWLRNLDADNVEARLATLP